MEFYKRRTRALKQIDQLWKAGKARGVIVFNVTGTFGVGKRMIEERFEQLELVHPRDEPSDPFAKESS